MSLHRTLVASWLLIVLISSVTVSGDEWDRLFDRLSKEALQRQFGSSGDSGQGSLGGESYTTTTADGWNLVVHRFRPPQITQPAPVVLCHGLGYNATFWNLDTSCSLATYLRDQGYDVWVVSLRGSGASQKWVWGMNRASNALFGDLLRKATDNKVTTNGYTSADPKYAKWDLDDHIRYDLPAIVELVQRKTGVRRIGWVGHSMGGIIPIAHLARYGNPGIGKLVTVGSQVTMPSGQVPVQFLNEMMSARQLQLRGQVYSEKIAAEAYTGLNNLFFNVHHTNATVYRRLVTTDKDIPSTELLKQYMVMSSEGELLSSNKKFNYARNLGNIRIPILVSCGEYDQLAPPNVQRYLYENVGSRRKKLVIFGPSSGFAAPAGHNDTLVGLTSRDQVYPVIERWIRESR